MLLVFSTIHPCAALSETCLVSVIQVEAEIGHLPLPAIQFEHKQAEA